MQSLRVTGGAGWGFCDGSGGRHPESPNAESTVTPQRRARDRGPEPDTGGTGVTVDFTPPAGRQRTAQTTECLMSNVVTTLLDFILDLLRNPEAAAEYDRDP